MRLHRIPGFLAAFLALLAFMLVLQLNLQTVKLSVAVGVQVDVGLSVKVMLLTPAFRNLDGSIEEAAQIAGASTLGTPLCSGFTELCRKKPE